MKAILDLFSKIAVIAASGFKYSILELFERLIFLSQIHMNKERTKFD